ncbi:MAG: BMP family ABC transporter substrate-binding protein, partial [Candidatus Heimdallarchaeota archaeon]|nr:BMP family ABC transporter substrate-binding protein [Candidatus Heimdallarchaeota archaeon]MCK5049700.1 BMP family ABC transporter substrate-binding protein [Candidatus Heimdallarchaeota archaeon]
AIGVDSNQDYLKPGYVLTSMIKRVDVAVYGDIAAIVGDTWTAGFTSLGLAEDGVGITEMEYTQDEKNAEYKSGTTNYEFIMEIKDDIIAGVFNVSEFTVAPEDNPTLAEEETPGFLFPIFAFGMIMVYAIRKRR